MKIKNEIVSLRIGNKKYEFNNLILDSYLNVFASSQIDKENISNLRNSKCLQNCLLKFDNSIKNISSDKEFYNVDFDVCSIFLTSLKKTLSTKQIVVEYTYNFNDVLFETTSGERLTGMSKFHGKKITAIGFNRTWMFNDIPICAILDVSNYNIYLQKNQDLVITRRDVIETEADFYSPFSNIEAPVHISPDNIEITENSNTYKCYPLLYSLGLSSEKNTIDREFVIGEHLTLENDRNLNELIYKINNIYKEVKSFLPLKTVFPTNQIFPNVPKYNKLIYKYKLYRINYDDSSLIDTGMFYYQTYSIANMQESNILDLTLKYERG